MRIDRPRVFKCRNGYCLGRGAWAYECGIATHIGEHYRTWRQASLALAEHMRTAH